jgi:hypothetical protein
LELHLYGSIRLGLIKRSLDVFDWKKTQPDVTKITMPLLGTGDSFTFGREDKCAGLLSVWDAAAGRSINVSGYK